uniref:Uncharacterized protein n=1 Tax=Anguilla anguilla TaxID=7936 RepID=A0A0E9T734_ANGAN
MHAPGLLTASSTAGRESFHCGTAVSTASLPATKQDTVTCA